MSELCTERWSDEVGCSDHAPSTEHECKRTGEHGTHVCRWCDAMVIEDGEFPAYGVGLAALLAALDRG